MAGERLAELGIHLRRPDQPGEHRAPCPECGRGQRDDALAVLVEPDGGATWLCHRCDWRGGFGPGRTEWTSRPVAVRQEAPPEPERHETLAPWGLRLWDACEPIDPWTVAATYLDNRHCMAPPGDLRWHPALPYRVRDESEPIHTGPALVGLVTDVETGEAISLHRTWIASDGSGKANVPKPRRLLWNHRSDGVIRLWPDEDVGLGLVIGEGIETCLSAATEGLTPVWATMSAGNLAAFPVLPGLEGLTILADHDQPNPKTGKRAGHEAASAVAQRYAEAGFDPKRDIKVIMPRTEGEDVADMVARKHRRAA